MPNSPWPDACDFNKVYKGTGTAYDANSNNIDITSPVTGSGFAFTSANASDPIFVDSGNNTAGNITYINTLGTLVTVQGAISRRKKAVANNLAFYFYGTGADAGKGFLLVEPPDEAIFPGNETVGTDSSPYLADLNAFLTAQVALPVITVSSVTVSEASPYAVFAVTLSNADTVNNTFTPVLASGTATVGTDTGSSLERFNGSSWVAVSSTVTIASGATTVLLRVAIVNDTTAEGLETFTLSTGTVTGGNVSNNGGTFGTGTIADNGSSANVFLASNNTSTPTIGTADNDGNTAPVNAVSGARTVDEDTALTFTAGNTLSVTDADGNLATVRVTVTQGTLTVSLAGGATLSAGASGSATLTLSGTQVQINAALLTLSYQGALNYNGSDTLTVLSTDGGSATDSDTVAITVNAVNDAPTLTAIAVSGTEDTTLTFTAANFTGAYADVESTPLASITVATLPATGLLKLSGVDVTVSQVITAANLPNLTYVPAANENGAKTFTVTASDGTASSAAATV